MQPSPHPPALTRAHTVVLMRRSNAGKEIHSRLAELDAVCFFELGEWSHGAKRGGHRFSRLIWREFAKERLTQ